MTNNLISHCYFNDDMLLIQFTTTMSTVGPNSILKSSNYSIRNGCISSHLSKYVCYVYDFGNSFIVFKVNPSFRDILDNSVTLEGGIIFKDSVNYIASKDGFICNFECGVQIKPPPPKASLKDCTITLDGNRKLILTDNNNISLKTLYPSDFFVNVNSNINETLGIFPVCIRQIQNHKYALIFTSDICSSPDDIIIISTIPSPSSTDIFKRTIQENDSATIKNTTLLKLINSSVYSYEKETLTIYLEFNAKLLRFDINDFNIFLDNKKLYSATKYRYLNDNFCFITIDNTCDFNPESSSLKIITKNKSKYYTIDSRFSPIYYSNISTQNLLLGISGLLTYDSSSHSSILIVNFNDKLEKLYSENLFATYTILDNSIINIKFDEFGELTLYGQSLIPLQITILPFTISTFENTLEVIFSSEISAYVTAQNIQYIDFKPLSKIKSDSKALSFSSFEVPINFTKQSSIIIQPDDFGDNWSLIGQDIYLPTILLVDKSIEERNYGNLSTTTKFHNGLYIKHLASDYNYQNVKIKIINIQADNLYTHLSDNYIVNFSNSTIEKLKILSEEIN